MGQGGETQRDTDTSGASGESMAGGESSHSEGGSPRHAPLDLAAAAAAVAAARPLPPALSHTVPHIQQAYNWWVAGSRRMHANKRCAWHRPAKRPSCLQRNLGTAAASSHLCHSTPPACRDCGLACVLMVLRALGMRQHHMGTLLEVGGGGNCVVHVPSAAGGRAGPAAILGAPVALLTTHCLLPPPQLCWLQLCPTRSIWTIDLAHLLAACGACVQLLTITIGANQVGPGCFRPP